MTISIVSFLIILCSIRIDSQDLSGMESACSYEGQKRQLKCSKFTSFKELDFTQSTVKFSRLVIEPDMSLKLRLNGEFSLKGLTMDWNNNANPPKITLKNIFGFDPFYNPFEPVQFWNNTNRLFDLEIDESEWRFEAADEEQFSCRLDTDANKRKFTFSDLNLNVLLIQDPKFFTKPKSICPILFQHSRIKQWEYFALDPVQYAHLDSAVSEQEAVRLLDIRVETLLVKFGYDSFVTELNEETLLNAFIFSQIEHLKLDIVYLRRVDGECFQKFPHLKSFSILYSSIEKLLANSGLTWMKYLNPNK